MLFTLFIGLFKGSIKSFNLFKNLIKKLENSNEDYKVLNLKIKIDIQIIIEVLLLS